MTDEQLKEIEARYFAAFAATEKAWFSAAAAARVGDVALADIPELLTEVRRLRETAPAWTHKAPTVEGWYWYRRDGWGEAWMVEIYKHGRELHARYLDRSAIGAADFGLGYILPGRWSGPIPLSNESTPG